MSFAFPKYNLQLNSITLVIMDKMKRHTEVERDKKRIIKRYVRYLSIEMIIFSGGRGNRPRLAATSLLAKVRCWLGLV